MSFIKVYIHFVWSTKNRIPFLTTSAIRKRVWLHIKENAFRQGIVVDFINGYADHCHCLVSLGDDLTIRKVIQLIKGESSYWINHQNDLAEALGGRKFQWQREYFAASVSESQLNAVRNYLKNQERHHQKKTFGHECDEIVKKFGLEKFNDSE